MSKAAIAAGETTRAVDLVTEAAELARAIGTRDRTEAWSAVAEALAGSAI